MKKFDGNIPDIQKLTDQKLTQELISHSILKNFLAVVYIFNF